MKALFLAGLCLATMLLCTACSSEVPLENNSKIECIGDLAYNPKQARDFRVYLPENGQYTPFLVLTNDYNGSTLLLREYLLDELHIYQEEGDYPNYYPVSSIDRYLEDEYLMLLSEKLRARILPTQIEVTSLEGIIQRKRIGESITRKVFLLSLEEVGRELGSITVKEGTALLYFSSAESIPACHSNGISETWFLRTPVITDEMAIISVSYDGSIGKGSIRSMAGPACCGVRPAFCLASSTPVEKIGDSGGTDGSGLYTIKFDTTNE